MFRQKVHLSLGKAPVEVPSEDNRISVATSLGFQALACLCLLVFYHRQ